VSTKANVITNEFMDGIRHIKVFNTSRIWRDNFNRFVRKFKSLVIKDAIWLAIPESGIQLLPSAILVGMVIFFKYAIKAPSGVLVSHLAAIGVYTFAFYRLIPYLTSFGRLRMQIMGTLPDVELIYRLLHQETDNIKDGNHILGDFTDKITFEDVSFSYKGKKDVLRNVNIAIEKDRTTAIVGPSGVGKSTVVNLILRLFKPDEGRITIDGVDLASIRYSSLAGMVGLVSQETFIFNASVKENILFGLEGISENKIIDAAKLANAHEFIVGFPNGYGTVVGDKGLKLSGGQRQRIAIARAILRDPKILILDEATSSLDHYSEGLVQDAINRASRDRTTIVIAHRLSTIMNADKIIVLDKGRVVQQGRHSELMQLDGIYRSLYKSRGDIISPPELQAVTHENGQTQK
ncbi:MAG: ATP-binding cassette domain-containing protein, partial [Candidatus Omnitrophota bacterium]